MTTSISKVEEITHELRDQILRGQYRPGERLPSERDLAIRFDANRGAVREALKKLELLGIAAIHPGGVRVVPVQEASLSVLGPLLDLEEAPDVDLVTHVFEVLGALLSMSARTAIQRATDSDLNAMLTIARRMNCPTLTPADNQQNWRELGTLFAQVNNNLVLRLIFNGLKTQFMDRLEEKDTNDSPFSLDLARRKRIYAQLEEGIATRDPKNAEDAIKDYFELINETVLKTLQPNAVEEQSL